MAAKKKSGSKSKSVARVAGSTLPKGYKALNARYPNWDHEANPVIEGERGAIREFLMDEGTKKERTQRVMTVTDGKVGTINVFESAALKAVFDDTEEGDTVYIKFLGLGKAKKGQNAPKLFETGVAA